MRIIAGAQRGVRLAALGKGDPGAHLRPTSDRVRESLFSMLTRYGHPSGRVLDLFAGTGALGLEALSRGAAHATFVENGRVGQRLLRENIALTRREADSAILGCDATRLPRAPEPCDLVFLDPPYGTDLGARAVAAARAAGWLAPDVLIVWEDSRAGHAAGLRVHDTRRFGDTWITLAGNGDAP